MAEDYTVKSPRWLRVGIGLLVAVTIGLVGTIFLKRQQAGLKQAAQREVASIADLKVDQVVNWRAERLQDGAFFLNARFVTENVLEFMENRTSPSAQAKLLDWLWLLKGGNRYQRILLCDAHSQVRLCVPPEDEKISEADKIQFAAVLKTNAVAMTDLHEGPDAGDLHLDILIPLLAHPPDRSILGGDAGHESPPAETRSVIGLLVLEGDPRQFLFALVQSWPTRSRTAETLLARREGDHAVILNPTQHGTNAALSLRLPLNRPEFPVVQAILGREGVTEGKDYRNRPVLAATRSIPGTPWFLVAEVDQDEVYANLWVHSALMLALIVFVILVAGLVIRLQKRGQLIRCLRISEERYRSLFDHSLDGVLLTTIGGGVLAANPAACRIFGRTEEELCRLGRRGVVNVTDPRLVPALEERARTGRFKGELSFLRKDGSRFPAEVSTTVFADRDGLQKTSMVVRDITERKQAEAAMQERLQLEVRLSRLAAAVPGVLYTFRLRPDGSTCLPYASPAIEEIFGIRSETLTEDASEIFRRIHPDDLAQVNGSIQASARTLSPWQAEFRVRHPDKGEIWAEGRSMPERERDGSILWHGFIHDITERRGADEALRLSQEKFVSIFRLSPDMIVLSSLADGRFMEVNDSAISILGYSREELIGHTSIELDIWCRPEDRAALLTRLARDGQVRNVEVPQRRKSGAGLWVSISAQAVEMKGERCMLAMVRDITERKQAEEQLRKLSRAVEQSPASIVITNPAGDIEYVNPKFTQVTGYSLEEVRGKNPRVLKSGETPGVEYQRLWLTITQGREWRGEFHNKKKNGELYWEAASISPIVDGAGRIAYFLAVKEDITERKQMELGRLRSLERQQRLNQLQQALLAPGDLVQKLKKITDGIVDIFGADFCRVWVIGPGDLCARGCMHAAVTEGPHICKHRDKCLRLIASSGRYTHTDGTTHRRVPFGAYKIGRVAAGQEHKLLTNDVVHDPRVHNHDWARELGLVSFVGYQLRPPEGETLGVLALFSQQCISPEEDAQLDALSTAVARVIGASQAEEALRKSEEGLRLSLDAAHAVAWELDLVGGVLHEVGPIAEVFGQGQGFRHGTHAALIESIHPEDRERVLAAIQGATGDENTYNTEFRVLLPGGSVRWIATTGRLVLDTEGRTIGVRGIARDVTALKQAEIATYQARDRAQQYLDLAGAMLVGLDADQKITLINRKGCDLLGYDQAELLGQDWFDVGLPAWERDRLRGVYSRLMAGEIEPLEYVENSVVQRGGGERTISWHNALIRDSHGRIVGTLSSGEDITERKVAEAALIESQRQFEAIFKHVRAGIMIIDPTNHRILQANAAALELLGAKARDVVGQPCRQFVCSEEAHCPLLSQRRTVVNSERLLTKVNGEKVPVLRTAVAVELNGGPCILESFVDLSAAKQAEEKRAQMQLELQRGQKLESVGRLAAGIAHEINTPTQYIGDNVHFFQKAFDDLDRVLQAHSALVSWLKEQGPVPAPATAILGPVEKVRVDFLRREVPKSIADALEGVDRVSQIVRAMKEFSHPGVEEKRPVDLNRAIESTLTVSRNEWKYVAEMVTHFDPDLPPVPCLPGEFNQVILNLVINAAHAIADVVGDKQERKGTITVSTRRCGEWVEVRVQDTGAGIPEGIRGRMFEPFFTTKAVGKGTGQGLALSRSVIVDKHKGTIAFETELGKGTAFIIRLPLLAAATNPKREAA